MSNRYSWHSTVDRELGEEDEPRKSVRRYIPSESKRWKMARESTEGGTATCEICHFRFGMSYIRWCKVAPFKVGHACVFCKKKSNLMEA